MPDKKHAPKKKAAAHKKQTKKKSDGLWWGVWLTLLFAIAVVFVGMQLTQNRDNLRRDPLSGQGGNLSGVDLSTATPAPTQVPATAKPTRAPEATPTPEITATETPAQPTQSPTPAPLPDIPVLRGVRPPQEPGFMAVADGVATDAKVVALTFDDCNQLNNLEEIIQLIARNSGKATLLPIGQNVDFLAELLREARALGFEIENHTYTHHGLYSADDETFVQEIWKQNRAVSEALGVDYQMHFLRPRGGDDRMDQRTHAYLRQLGYYGIAYWAQVGSGSTANAIMRDLKPGNIILFHTTHEDVEIVKELVPKLVKQGYRMVTLNELYGLPENETSPLTEDPTAPALQPYERINQAIKPGEYSHDIYLMQEKLTELGFLTAEYNGFFGQTTMKALVAFQKSQNLVADGICGAQTWKALFGE